MAHQFHEAKSDALKTYLDEHKDFNKLVVIGDSEDDLKLGKEVGAITYYNMSEFSSERDASPFQSYNYWARAVSKITGSKVLYDEEDDCIDLKEPLVRGVETPQDLINKFGHSINVRVLGDIQAGYTIRLRGRWPFSLVQLSYHIVLRGRDEVLIASEETKSKRFIMRPWIYEDDFTKAPQDETVEHFNPELDPNQQSTLHKVLANAELAWKQPE